MDYWEIIYFSRKVVENNFEGNNPRTVTILNNENMPEIKTAAKVSAGMDYT